ncbi:hypothetical protein BDZ45DRAFT_781233 [Acephala macrosclerotiorum]|nr:hypothetical protein BDZ45DRAFT_781233 [Acephala macrosclerotiorum]
MTAKRKRAGAAKQTGQPAKKRISKRSARSSTPVEEPEVDPMSDTGDYTEVVKVHHGWSVIELDYLFVLIKRKLKEVKMTLTPKDFGSIAESMEEVFSGKSIQEGDEMVARLKDGVYPPTVAGSSFPYKIRTAAALHSYAMHKGCANRPTYDKMYEELKARNFEDSDTEEEEDQGEEGDYSK